MDPIECPLPEIADTLAPYIKTRDEVAAIRRGLQSHLQAQTRKGEVPLANVNLTSPSAARLGPLQSSLSGVRKAYWKALEAHLTAQAKHDALRTEVEKLGRRPSAGLLDDSRRPGSGSEDYIALLRQREKLRKLKVLDRALSKITSLGDSSSATNLDDMIKKQVGDLPVPPIAQPSLSRDPGVDAKIMELKKAVVFTKRSLDQHKKQSVAQTSNALDEISPEAEVAGLQKALQELTTWMDAQLTVIAEAEANGQQPSEDVDGSSTVDGSHVSIEDIEPLYERYLEARRQLVQSINDFAESGSNAESGDPEASANQSTGRSKSSTPITTKSSAAVVLPFMPALLAAKFEEHSLVQQSGYVRRQIAAAEDETARLIQRLADESHLVPPGASQGQHWADAAKDAGKTTNQSIKERLKTGGASAESAKETLDSIKNLTGS